MTRNVLFHFFMVEISFETEKLKIGNHLWYFILKILHAILVSDFLP